MPAYALFLRAVNVGGNNNVIMTELQSLIEDRGFKDVATLLQSGNAIFSGEERAAEVIESQFEQALRRKLEVECSCFVRTAAEWTDAIASNPFSAEAKNDPSHLLVVLLKSEPSAPALKDLRAAFTGPERFQAMGRQLYVVYPDGIGKSKLTIPLIERHLGTRATGRNWNTVLKVAQLLGR